MTNEKASFLEGDYDFIEESVPFSTTPLDFKESNEVIISEAKGEKSPYKILGRVSGCFAPIAAYSRNKRIYESSHWDYVLQDRDLQERLAGRRIFGELGHENKKIDDTSNRAGNISHIVTKMEVREDANGTPFLFGEFEILDTPAGRILEAMYKGGAGLFVSSRAAGKLRPMEGNPGMSVVCKESYYLHSWDVVLEPGYLQAHPAFEAVEEPTTQSHPIVAESKVAEVQSTPEVSPIAEGTSELQSQIDKLAKIVEKVVEGMDSNKVFDLDHKINNVEKIRKEEREKLLNSKDHLEAHKSEARIAQADNLLKRLNKSRKEALGESQASLIGALALLQEANLSEEAMEEIVDEIKKGLK